jgi:hypothetical protein
VVTSLEREGLSACGSSSRKMENGASSCAGTIFVFLMEGTEKEPVLRQGREGTSAGFGF